MPSYTCPTCHKTFEVDRKENAPHRPFCTDRCKMVDLGRWLDGTYRVSDPSIPNDNNDDDKADEQ